MNKPLLVICPGLMKCGTTSLYKHFYTSYLLHFGHGKEHYYLNNIYQNDYSSEEYFKENFLTEKIFTFRENHCFKSFNHYYKERTLENYKNYFLEISEYYVDQKQMFYGVADFSQSYQSLSLDQIKHFRDYIVEYFDVKIIRLVRDPVRRLYSYCNMVVGKEKAKEYFYHLLTDKEEYAYYSKINSKFIFNWSSDIWGTKISSVFVYENIFNHESDEIEKLHEFIGIPYLPIDRNNIEIKTDYKDKLTPEDIDFAKLRLKQEYASFHLTQRMLPNSWEYSEYWNYESVHFEPIVSNYKINPVDLHSQ
jgi:hypothetical protein